MADLMQMVHQLIGKLSADNRALLAKALQGEPEPIAIIGMGCRFPGGATDPEAYWKFLAQGGDGIRELPAGRFDIESYFDQDAAAPGKTYAKWGGFVDGLELFDPYFFGISPREAEALDPQQRLLLEVAWEALEDAGLDVAQLAGSATGVFVGQYTTDYFQLQLDDLSRVDAYSATGATNSMGAGRVAYSFDFRGPSMIVDTVCSSALVATHLAIKALREGECNMALAGGVNAILAPWAMVASSKLGALSPQGYCRTFDARADGFVRGEGCGLLVLKRLSDALSSNDSVLAVIRGSAVNQDGRSNGLTAPNGQAQKALLRAALANARLQPDQIGYLEAHGTGTPLGDPIEVDALREVFGARSPKLVVGSVKTNFGHLEAAAGAAGLIKLVLSLQHQQIPPHLHFKKLNPRIGPMPFEVPTQLMPWSSEGPRRAGVSAFGLSGTNAHVVLEEAPKPTATESKPFENRSILLLSAKDPGALVALAARYRERLAEPVALTDLLHSAAVRRTAHGERLAVVGGSAAELIQGLERFEKESAGVRGTRADQPQAPVLVFSGQGAQWARMGVALLARSPVFRAKFEQCDRALQSLGATSLQDALHASESESRLAETQVAQPAIFAVQVALAALLAEYGVTPAGVVGHSVGEIAAAHVAGILTLQDAIELVYHRSRLMQAATGRGKMAMVELAEDAARAALAGYENRISIAVLNGPKSTVYSGEPEALEALLGRLSAQGVVSRMLRVDYAFHCPQMAPYAAELSKTVAHLKPKQATIPMISSVTGDLVAGPELNAEYWARNVLEPVRFLDAVKSWIQRGQRWFWELAPHPVLSVDLGEILRATDSVGVVVSTLRRGVDDEIAFLEGLGRFWTHGGEFERGRLAPGGRYIRLPHYPWQKQRYWFQSKKRPQVVAGRPLLGAPLSWAQTPEVRGWQQVVSVDAPTWLAEHQVHGAAVVPGAAFVEMFLAAGAEAGLDAVRISNLKILQRLELQPDGGRDLQLNWDHDAQICSRGPGEAWVRHVEARLEATAPLGHKVEPLAAVQARLSEPRAPEAHYGALARAGIELGATFQPIRGIQRGGGEALLTLQGPQAGAYVAHPALLDACLQALLPASEATDASFMPVGAQTIEAATKPFPSALYCHAKLSQATPSGLVGDVQLFDEAGQIWLEVKGFEVRRVEDPRQDPLSAYLFDLSWRPAPAVTPKETKRWLVLGDQFGAENVAAALTAKGASVERPAVLTEALRTPSSGLIFVAGTADTAEAARHNATSLLLVVQTIVQAGLRDVPRVYVVTQGAQGLGAPVVAAGAACWGLGRTVAAEHPELRLTRIDVDATQSEALARELLSADVESQVALRGQERWVLRLTRRSARAATQPRFDGVWVVTGGLGGLGRTSAAWLAENGARRVILVGRSAPSAEAATVIESMRARGVQVDVFAADLASENWQNLLLQYLEGQTLEGIIHAAGVLDDGTLLQQNATRFATVFGAKVDAAYALDALQARYFVVFASASGILEAPGQANYAAANATLDALMARRRQNGQHGLSIDWGAWSEVGMAAERAQKGQRNPLQGTLSPNEGLSLLGRLLAQEATQVAAMPFVFKQWSQVFLHAANNPFFAELATDKEVISGVRLREKLLQAPVDARVGLLENHVKEQICKVLRVEPARLEARTAFGNLGMDSLMALEIRNRLESSLGLSLSATLAFSQPTLSTLVPFLADKLELKSNEATSATEDVAVAEVEQLSQEEAKEALEAELAELESLL